MGALRIRLASLARYLPVEFTHDLRTQKIGSEMTCNIRDPAIFSAGGLLHPLCGSKRAASRTLRPYILVDPDRRQHAPATSVR